MSGLSLKQKLANAERDLAVAQKQGAVKEATILQMNDLLAKNFKLKSDLADMKSKVKDIKSLEDELFESNRANTSLKKDVKELERRLGSKDYRTLTFDNLETLTASMDDSVRDVFEQVSAELDFTERDIIKLALALVQEASLGAKFAFIKTLFALEEPSMRSSAFNALGKMVRADRTARDFVKEITDRDGDISREVDEDDDTGTGVKEELIDITAHETTPRHTDPFPRKAVHDPSAVIDDIERYHNGKNETCRVVKIKNTSFLAATTNTQFIKKHVGFTQNGRDVKSTCLGCGNVYKKDVTEIGPMIVVAPHNHGRLGEQVWLCRKHWEVSVLSEEKDEVDMGSVLAEQESLEYLEASPVLKRKRPVRASAVRRTKLVFEKAKVGGVEALREDETPMKRKKGEGPTDAVDVAADEEEKEEEAEEVIDSE